MVRELRFLVWAKGLKPDDVLPREPPGDGGTFIEGEDANEPALNGWKETDGLRGFDGAVSERKDERDPCDLCLAGILCGGVSTDELEWSSLTARKADKGLEPRACPFL